MHNMFVLEAGGANVIVYLDIPEKAPIPHIALNEKELVLASLCATGEPCSQLAAVTALCLESPKPAFGLHHHLPPQRERMELRCFAQAVV